MLPIGLKLFIYRVSYILFMLFILIIHIHCDIRYNTEPKITQRYDTIKHLMRKILDLQA